MTEHLGDIVAIEPAIRELKESTPSCRIYWIVRKDYSEVIKANPYVDVVIKEFSALHSIMLLERHPFDNLYNCHLSGAHPYEYLGIMISNKRALTQNILIQNYFDHGNLLTVFSKISGLPLVNKSPKIYIPKSVENKVSKLNLGKHTLVIHTCSNQSDKDWQVGHWRKLIRDLSKSFDYQIIEVGLKSKLEINEGNYVNLSGKLTILETAEVIKKANYFIGVDSGPAHIANAVGTYAFLLFGKYKNFESYMPYSGGYQSGDNAKIIFNQLGPCSELSYSAVWEAIASGITTIK